MPLLKKHWTPRYIRDRLAVMRWERANPDKPWLVRQAVETLDELLHPTDTLVEFGSGRSTAWFAARVARVISIEDFGPWFEKVSADLASSGVRNVELLFAGQSPEAYLAPATRALEQADPRGLADAVLVDGFKHRDHAAMWALERLRPGGLLVIDNINWYLPHATRSPASVGPRGQAATPLWAEFAKRVSAWRSVWFSSGVSDTAIWFVPGDRADQRAGTRPEVAVRSADRVRAA